jgi:asparagine synthase (glutamine-hydrolysing)
MGRAWDGLYRSMKQNAGNFVYIVRGMDKYGNFEIASEMKALDKCVRVEHMPAGHYMYFDVTGVIDRTSINYFSATKYGKWSALGYEPTPAMLDDATEAALCKQIRSSFEAAVIKRLMTDVPFGVLLSGGLDSSLVATCTMAYMRQHPEKYGAKPELHTFSIGLKGAPDLKYARAVADFLGTHHHEIHFTVEEGLNALHDVIYHLETYDITTIRASTGMYLLTR